MNAGGTSRNPAGPNQAYISSGIEESVNGAAAPRLHVLTHEPVELTQDASADLFKELSAIGHDVRSVQGVAGRAHCAEVLHHAKQVRAGGNGWAAGVE